MFIKKDLRKIPTILAEAAPEDDTEAETMDTNATMKLTELPLQRRKGEFNGSVKVLCAPSTAPALIQLKSLSLYDCEICDLCGIGLCENLVSLNLGRNPISELPVSDFEKFTSLETLCLDDCSLQGPLPEVITRLDTLKELRMTNNKITILPSTVANLYRLEVLGLDKNEIPEIPVDLTDLINLKTLLLRGNRLTVLPMELPHLMKLKLLHISSNQLRELPDSLVDCTSLTHLYANGNAALSKLPAGIEDMPNLVHCNVAHCIIDVLSSAFCDIFGAPNPDGICGAKEGCKVVLTGNPVLLKKYDDDDDDIAMGDAE
jgi:Leucine-rich repeat (LRR) protein